jgi:hypothetical protein
MSDLTDDGIVESAPPEVVFGDQTHITLRYIGRDVENGSIAVDDLLAALNGFSSAFYKLAERESLDYKQRIKVTGISKSSANVHLEIFQWAQNHPVISSAITTAAGAVGTALTDTGKALAKKLTDIVIERIVNVAKAKKHVQRGDYKTEVTGDGNTIIIINGVNAQLPVSRADFEILDKGVIDSELDKMASPLREDFIDAFEIRHDQKEAPDLHIEASDRPYFAKPRREAATTQEVTLIGTMTSISKTTNSGVFVIDNGKKVRFKFSDAGKLPDFYLKFAHLGPVRVTCKAKLDDNLDVISIEISDVRPLTTTF